MKYGIQLYSIRDMAKKDLAEAVKTVADIGYDMVEKLLSEGNKVSVLDIETDNQGRDGSHQ